jgi:hypothetical protein
VVAIVALLLALAARKKELTCTYLGASKLVSIDPGGVHPDVRMEFRGVTITSLYKLSFRLKNTGAAAIKRADVSDPITLRFSSGTKLLNTTVERTIPSRFPVSASLDGTSVLIDFPLLNSGDEADLAVYIYNSAPSEPSFEGRIVDVKQFLISDTQGDNSARLAVLHNTAVREVLYWFLVLLYSGLSIVALAGAFAVPTDYVRGIFWNKNWKAKYDAERSAWRAKEVQEEEAAWNDWKAKLNAGIVVLHKEGDEGSNAQVKMLPSPRSADIRVYLAKDDPFIKLLKEKGIPQNPFPFAETLWGTIGATFVLLAVSAIFAMTAYLSHVALR